MRRWDWFGRLADVVTILAAVGALISVIALSSPVQQIIMAGTLSMLAVVATIVAWLQSRQLHEAARTMLRGEMVVNSLDSFAAAIDDLTRGHKALSTEVNGQADPQAFVNRCETACRTAAVALEALTRHPCRVTLQELYTTEKQGETQAAVRTIATSDRNGATGQASVDWVDDNTDFRELVAAGAEYFHSHDLRINLREGYRNSHWTGDKLKEWNRTGDYPYLSTVVLPVCVRVDGRQRPEMAGFLSVDSKGTHVFDLAVVRPLIAALASAAYTGLSSYGTIKRAQEHPKALEKDN